jgi:hypothetical protein
MTTYYADGENGIVSFETDPSQDINADAKCWTPDTEQWNPCKGGGLGASVLYGGDYYPIPESAVPQMQQRCRERMQRWEQANTDAG